ncbi:MAG: GNAT family N-acetyltransferase, partial [Flavobacteriaceae bacterium]|nr:GNAT family N-acetyltransferase [Flavobacteriaceae bacterium]
VIDLSKAHGASSLWLGVWEKNLKAIEFYKRHGFTKFGEHPYLIGEDEQYDWMMRLDLV